MKEVKFRVWDKEDKKWVTKQNSRSQTNLVYDTNYLQVWCQYELNQFTGLHDKDGVEVYESDIIEVNGIKGYGTEVIENFEVIFREGMFCIDNGYEYVKLYDFMTANHKPLGEQNATKVIGNIYQNSELLTK